jgi:hypothetical protein
MEYECRQEIDSAIKYHGLLGVEFALELNVPNDLSVLPVWYFGMKANNLIHELIICRDVTKNTTDLLPKSHSGRAVSWIALLTDMKSSEGLQWKSSVLLDLVGLVRMFRFIHHFEEASGNGSDDFDLKSTLLALGLSGLDVLVGTPEYSDFDGEESDSVEWWYVHGAKVEEAMAASCKIPYAIKSIFPNPESLFYTLWYSCFVDFSLKNEEKQNILFSDARCDFGVRAKTYDAVRDAYQ